MFTLKNHRNLISIAILSTLFVKDALSCFTSNTTTPPVYLLIAGTNYYRDCICEEPQLSTRNLKWLDNNNKEIKGPGNGSKVYTEFGHRNLKLYIEELNKSHTGLYTCISKGSDGHTYARQYSIEVYEPLYFVGTKKKQYLISGQDSFISCDARGHVSPRLRHHQSPRITWFKGQDETLISNSKKYQILEKGLLIRNASVEDAGRYFCKATVIYTAEEDTRPIDVEVYTPPTVADIIAIPGESIIAGESVTLDCKAGGYPLPKYIWRKVSDKSANATVSGQQEFNKVTFENITMDDQGTYECIAENEAGKAKRNISIEVLATPIIEGFENITINEGVQVSVVCKGVGRPPPNINITYYGDHSESAPGYTTSSDNSTFTALNLTFEKVAIHHEGWYDCNASNTVGSEQKSMYLKVSHKPIFEKNEEIVWAWEGKTADLNCEHTSEPQAEIKWSYLGNKMSTIREIERYQFWTGIISKKNEPHIHFNPENSPFYGIYECVAKNLLGEAKKVFKVEKGSKPPQIQDVYINDTAASSATFDIVAPEITGPNLTGFHAEYDETENYKITDIHLNRTWAINNAQFKIEHLKPKTNYSIRFAAQNEVGIGPFGRFYNFETPEKSSPEPPSWDYDSEPVLISAANKTLRLRPPEHNGDPIDYYAIKYCPIDDSTECIEETSNPGTEIKMPELNKNKTYFIDMIAHNSVGNSTSNRLVIYVADGLTEEIPLSAGAIIALSIVLVIFVILLLDLILFCTKKQGMIANCYNKKNKKEKEDGVQSKDKKGLLKDNGEVGDTLKRPDNGHKEFEYNKTTGVITGKHSAV